MDAQNIEFKEKSNPAELKLASQLVIGFLGLLKASALYPQGHQMLLQVIEKFYSALKQILAQKLTISFKIFKNKLFVFEEYINQEKIPAVETLIQEMQKRYIRQIIFNMDVAVKEIALLVDLLKTDPKIITDLGGAELTLSQRGAQHVQITEYYYRRHTELNQERLIDLIHSEIFSFFTTPDAAPLNNEQIRSFYELIKEPQLMFALLKVAAHSLIREGKTQLSENQLVLQMLKKIKQTIASLGIFEEHEIKSLLHDILASDKEEGLFNLLFEYPEDEIIDYAQIPERLSSLLNPQKLAQLMAAKIAGSKQDLTMITHAKQVLHKLFLNRQMLLSFLPALKEKLKENFPSPTKAENIFNDICSAFGSKLSITDDVELALGTISETESSGIEFGLEVLKSVQIEKEKLEQSIAQFSFETSYLYILQTIISQEQDAVVFQFLLNKLVQILKGCLENVVQETTKQIISFLSHQLLPEEGLNPGHNQYILNAFDGLSLSLFEKGILVIISDLRAEEAKKFLEQAQQLLKDRLVPVLIKIYLSPDPVPHQELLKKIISSGFNPQFFKFDTPLHKEQSAKLTKILELLQKIQSAEALPLLWEITFHEDLLLAQRALSILADNNPDRAIAFILKAANHPNIQLRFSNLALMSRFKQEEIIAKLYNIAAGHEKTNDQNVDIESRIIAIKSLSQLEVALAKQSLFEIINKKRFLFLPVEPKRLRQFAKEQVLILNKQ